MKPYDKKADIREFINKLEYTDIIFWADYYEIDNDGCFWLCEDWDGDFGRQKEIMDKIKKEVIDKMNIDDLMYQFSQDLEFDALKHWCAILDIDYDEPPLDDMYPDWEGEIRDKICEEMGKVGKWLN